MKWFSKVTSIDDLRAEYKRLLMKHHPDNGGEVSDMQKINAEYDALFSRFKEEKEVSGQSSNQENEENEAIKEVLNTIISYHI